MVGRTEQAYLGRGMGIDTPKAFRAWVDGNLEMVVERAGLIRFFTSEMVLLVFGHV